MSKSEKTTRTRRRVDLSTGGSFPLSWAPDPIREFIKTAAEALPCPPEMVGIPVLTSLSTAIGNRRWIEVKPGWKERPCLYTAVVALPGDRKSPALNLSTIPIYEKQDELYRDYSVRKQQYEKASDKEKQQLPKPSLTQVVTTDSTVEAAAELHQTNLDGFLYVQDELSRWVRSMNQYKGGQGGDRQFWLLVWSGGHTVVNRKGKEPIIINDPFISVTGCIPPDILPDLSDHRGRQDGFLDRICFSYPDPVEVRWSNTSVPECLLNGYRDIFNRLWGLEWKTRRFTKKAKRRFIEWFNTHHEEMEQIDYDIRGHWAKLDGICARLSLLIHEARCSSGEKKGRSVDLSSVESGIDLVDYFKAHARKVRHRLRTEKEDTQISNAVRWIQDHGGETTAREVNNRKVSGVSNSEEAKELLKSLEEKGYGEVISHKRKSIRFRLSS